MLEVSRCVPHPSGYLPWGLPRRGNDHCCAHKAHMTNLGCPARRLSLRAPCMLPAAADESAALGNPRYVPQHRISKIAQSAARHPPRTRR